jgi:membrane associated rhomboid family serine protease
MDLDRDQGVAAVAAVLAGYAAAVVAWRLLVRRWGLVGPAVPPPQALGKREQRARRTLRALVALDALVVVPGVAAALVVFALRNDFGFAPALLLPTVLFVAPVPALLRQVRVFEALRRRGLPEPAPAPVRQASTGHASLDVLLGGAVPVTHVTAGLIVAASLLAWFVPGLPDLLEKDNAAIRDGELWRLFTVALVHANVIHLFFNVSVFLDVSGILERLVGPLRTQLVFWVGTAAATGVSVAVFTQPSVGASGGVFALLGALWAVGTRHRHELPPAARSRFVRSTAMVIGANILLGFALPHVDWAAHLGGLVAGAAMGWLFGMGPAARAALGKPGGGDSTG